MDFEGIPGSMGRLADGSAFFDRQEIMSRAWDLLRTSNLLLLAPRRVGKSSRLNRMKQDGAARGYNTLYLSVPDAEDELDFIKRLVRGFRDAEWTSGGWVAAFKDKLPADLEFVLKTGLIELKVNGKVRQTSDLSKMIWTVPETIAYLSGLVRLAPGDLIFTGTPEGAAAVERGDLLEGVVEGVGTVRTRIA